MRVLLTGAGSALGRSVAAALEAAGHTVRATDSLPLPPGTAVPAAGFQPGDLTDPAFAAAQLEGREAIIHLAPLRLPEVMPAEAPGEVLDAATRGTHVLLKAALDAGISLMVQGSTLAVMDAYDANLEVNEQWRPRPTPHPSQMAPYLAELTAREFTRDIHVAAPPSIACLRFDQIVDAATAQIAPAESTGTAAKTAGPAPDVRGLAAADAAQAVVQAMDTLARGDRQRGHRWHLYHVAPRSPYARYTSAAAQRALGWGAAEADGGKQR